MTEKEQSEKIRYLEQELAALRYRNHSISKALDECPEAIAITNTDGLIEYVNPAYTAISGYSRVDVVGKKTSFLISGDNNELVYTTLWKTVLAGNRWEGEISSRRKDGATYWEKNTIAPCKNENGEITHFIFTKVEVTPLKDNELGQQETLFWQKKILETLPIGIAIESGGKIIWVNGNLEEITSIKADAIIGKPIEELFPVRKKLENLSMQAKEKFTNGKTFQIELKLKHQISGEIWCGLKAIALKYGNHQLEIIWLLQNITNRKLVEQQLGESEELYRNAFSRNASAMFVVSYPDGLILEANDAFETLTGFEKKYAVGRTAKDLYIWSNQGRQTIYSQIDEQGIVRDYDAHYYTKNRHRRSCRVNVALVDNHKGKQLFISFVDTTAQRQAVKALKESEEMFRFMAEGISDVISLHNPDMEATINYISPAIKQVTGRSPEELTGKSPEGLIFRDDWIDNVTNAMLRMYTGGSLLELVEFRVISTGGDVRWVESTLKPMFDESGKISMIIAVSRDISHRKEIEQQLREVNSMKDKFLSIIAHDLKNPFNALLGFSSLLLSNLAEYDRNRIKEFVSEIHNAAQGGVDLLEELMQWAMVQSGAMTFAPETVRLSDISKEVFELASIQAATKHLFLVDNISERYEVFADKRMVATILRNLVTNAIKFTKPGGVVKVTAERIDKLIAVTVADSGVGIQQQDLEKLFRIDVKPSEIGADSVGKGTGLGLILCDEFVKRHGGTISAKSVFGQGAEFTFTLPAPPKQPLLVAAGKKY
ncbi:MAG TPA: PAS domain S-box protein [Williamwhitmania sp.]|nr:PAS domain S-box protein [Williamwhitmania sp.]